jgi:branched-chain amino acid transport system permease protein
MNGSNFWLVRIGSILLAVAGAFVINAAAGGNDFTQRLVLLAALYVTLAVSLNLINGITGQFSMGHAAFYMVGAYTAAIATLFNPGVASAHPLPWLLAMMVAGSIAAGLAGLLVGVPSLRLRGDYLAIVTLGFGEIVRIVAQNVKFGDKGGSYGFSVDTKVTAVWLAWLLAFTAIALCRNLLSTARGLTFLAVREDETASLAMGVNVTQTKVTAFVIGSALAGAAGAMLAHFEGFVSSAMFTMDVSFIIVTMVVLGGTGSITGAVVAALLLFLLPEKMRDLPSMPIGGVGAFFIVLALVVAGLRYVSQTFHGAVKERALRYVGVVVIGLVTAAILGFVLNQLPAVKAAPLVEGAKLRMVVFAVTLIVLMLLRPQGIFGHHEFSWDWLRSRLKPKSAEVTPV